MSRRPARAGGRRRPAPVVALAVVAVAYGSGADLRVLTKLAEATDAAVYDASDPSSIDKVFTAVVSNF